MENLITFEGHNKLKVKIINVSLPRNTQVGHSISISGIPSGVVYISGFLFNYIKTNAQNIYEFWDIQVSLPSTCIVKSKKEYSDTGYATILAFYR